MSTTPDAATETEARSVDQPSRRRVMAHTALMPVYLTILAAYFVARGSTRLLSCLPSR